MPVAVEMVKETPVNGRRPSVGDFGESSSSVVLKVGPKLSTRILDKYNVGKNGVLFIDTSEGRFSPIDLEYGRIVLMTRTLVNKRAEFRNGDLEHQIIKVVYEGRPNNGWGKMSLDDTD